MPTQAAGMDSGVSKVPKWPFLLADFILVGFAVFLVIWFGDTPDPAITAIATLLGVAGGVAGVAPFLMEHQQESRKQADLERAVVRELTAKVAQIGRELDESAVAVRKAVDSAAAAVKLGEALPSRMQAAVNELERRIVNANAENSERFAMVGEQLQTSVQQVVAGEQNLTRVQPVIEALQNEIASLNMALARAEFDRRNQAPAEPPFDPVLREAVGRMAERLDTLAGSLGELREKTPDDAQARRAADAVLVLDRKFEEQVGSLHARLDAVATRLEEVASRPAPTAAPVAQTAHAVPEPLPAVVEETEAPAEAETPSQPPPSRKRKLSFSGMLAGSLLQPQTPAVERIISGGRVPVPEVSAPAPVAQTGEVTGAGAGETPAAPEASGSPVDGEAAPANPGGAEASAVVVTEETPSKAVVEERASPGDAVVDAAAPEAVVVAETGAVVAPLPEASLSAPESTPKPTVPPKRSRVEPALLDEPDVAAAAQLLHDGGILSRLAELSKAEDDEPALALDLGELPGKPKTPKFEPAEGAAVLVARAYIGIGNKLHVRGEGPGLSREKGVPLVFLEIGKWGWACPEPYASVKCTLYRNDEQPDTHGEISIAGGETREVSPAFGGG